MLNAHRAPQRELQVTIGERGLEPGVCRGRRCSSLCSNAAKVARARTYLHVLDNRGQGVDLCTTSDTSEPGVGGSNPPGCTRGESGNFRALTCGKVIYCSSRCSNGPCGQLAADGQRQISICTRRKPEAGEVEEHHSHAAINETGRQLLPRLAF